jgi:hypothetical protein
MPRTGNQLTQLAWSLCFQLDRLPRTGLGPVSSTPDAFFVSELRAPLPALACNRKSVPAGR